MKYAQDRLETAALGIVEEVMATQNPEVTVQFLLDPSTSAEFILANDVDDFVVPTLFRVTSIWCYSLHKLRLKLLENQLS